MKYKQQTSMLEKMSNFKKNLSSYNMGALK